MCYTLGVEVAPKQTDAVVMDRNGNLLAAARVRTSDDIFTGMEAACAEVLLLSGIRAETIGHVMVGTAAYFDARLQSSLARTGLIRLSRPAGTGILPLETWPKQMREAVGDSWRMVSGGFEYDGRLLAPLNLSEVREALLDLKRDGIKALAVAGLFATVCPDQELAVAAVGREVFGPDFPITLSHEVGRTGLVERENAAVLNAALTGMVAYLAAGIHRALGHRGIRAKLFLAQNNGTLMSFAYGSRYPILSVGSAPAISARGAAFLSGLQDCVVVDVGSQSTTVTLVLGNFPRECDRPVQLGGVSLHVRMPETITLPLGGDHLAGDRAGDGPGVRQFQERLGQAVDQISAGQDYLPVVLVGSGTDALPERLAGPSTPLRPRHAYCAGAVGLTISPVSGEVDRVWSLERYGREEILNRASAMACERAVQAGCDPEGVGVAEIEESPLTYLPSRAVRVKVKAVGSPVP